MGQFIPPIGTAGLFTLKEPFNTLLIPGVSYAVTAQRTISEMLSKGVDVEAEYYTPHNLDNDAFKADANADAVILTLQAGGLSVIHVPSTYILGQPEIGGVPYTGMMLTIRLGAIANNQDLSVVKEKIASDVLELLGVQATVREVVISPTTLLTVEQAKLAEAARAAKIGTVVTDYTKYLQAQNALIAAQQQIAQLEQYIRDNAPPAP